MEYSTSSMRCVALLVGLGAVLVHVSLAVPTSAKPDDRMIVGHMRQDYDEMLDAQNHLQLESTFHFPEFMAKYHILPIVDQQGKLKWSYSSDEPNAQKPWIGNPEQDANFHFDFHRFGLDRIGLSPEKINSFVARDSQPQSSREDIQSNLQTARPLNLDHEVAAQPIRSGMFGKVEGLMDHLRNGRDILRGEAGAPPHVEATAASTAALQRPALDAAMADEPLSPEDVDFFSDISHEKLEYGQWFHRIGADFDISDSEWTQLPVNEKTQFELVATPQDKLRIAREKLSLNVESSPLHLPLGKDGKARSPGLSTDSPMLQNHQVSSEALGYSDASEDADVEAQANPERRRPAPSPVALVVAQTDAERQRPAPVPSPAAVAVQPSTVVYQTNVYTDSRKDSNPITVTGSQDGQPLQVGGYSEPQVQPVPPMAQQYSQYPQPMQQPPLNAYQQQPAYFTAPQQSGYYNPQQQPQFAPQQYPPQQYMQHPQQIAYQPQYSNTAPAPSSPPSQLDEGFAHHKFPEHEQAHRQEGSVTGGVTMSQKLEEPSHHADLEAEEHVSVHAVSEKERREELKRQQEMAKQKAEEEAETGVTSEEAMAVEEREGATVHFFSNLSDKPLVYGKWYHKLGSDFDITAEEYLHKIKDSDKDKFVLIKSAKDRLVVEKAAERTGYLSSLSEQPLRYGHWYHKDGADFDVSDIEYNTQIPTAEKSLYSKIRTKEDKIRVKIDSVEFNRPVFSDISSTPLQYGHWYHKLGSNFDITDAELHSMIPETERQKYSLVSSKEDRLVIEDAPIIPEAGPVILNNPMVDSTPSGPAEEVETPEVPAHSSKPEVEAHSPPAPSTPKQSTYSIQTPPAPAKKHTAIKAPPGAAKKASMPHLEPLVAKAQSAPAKPMERLADRTQDWSKATLMKDAEAKAVSSKVGRQTLKPTKSVHFKTKAGAMNVMAQRSAH